MEQPPCFERSNKRNLVCRLNKALYGLKQSSRVWNAKLDAALRSFELLRSKYDPCLYYLIDGNRILFVAIYVDDVIIFSNDEALTNDIKAKLSDAFRMKDLEKASNCLGIRITREKNAVALDQEAYIESVLARFNMDGEFETSFNSDESMCDPDQGHGAADRGRS